MLLKRTAEIVNARKINKKGRVNIAIYLHVPFFGLTISIWFDIILQFFGKVQKILVFVQRKWPFYVFDERCLKRSCCCVRFEGWKWSPDGRPSGLVFKCRYFPFNALSPLLRSHSLLIILHTQVSWDQFMTDSGPERLLEKLFESILCKIYRM